MSAKHVIKAFTPKPKSVIVSAIQPTGVFHLGNYLGAVQGWTDLTRLHANCQFYFFTADLHALTVPREAHLLRTSRERALASILACGVDPTKVALYHQSAVKEHTYLSWILSTITSVGALNRMTQWKSKQSAAMNKLRAGLFTYPILMAADVLIHQADLVPVGLDQTQHLELTRDIAVSFNKQFCDPHDWQLQVPETMVTSCSKVFSLRDPSKKMSKSDPDPSSCIYISDDDELIAAKIKTAITDSIQGVPFEYDPERRPGVSNLIRMASSLRHMEPHDFSEKYLKQVRNHMQLKSEITEAIIDSLAPIRRRFLELKDDHQMLASIAAEGAHKASKSARATLAKIEQVVGLDLREDSLPSH